MIYSRPTTFSYPVLSNIQTDYSNNIFEFDADLKDNNDNYIIVIKYKISSVFIKNLISKNKARIILIIQSNDNIFSIIDPKNLKVEISKSRLNLNNQTKMQLFIQSTEQINFKDNLDLSDFFNEYKSHISVNTSMLLAFSDVITFDGRDNQSPELFKRIVNPELESDIEISLNDEFIIINFKNDDFQFPDLPNSRDLNNPYIILGLYKALISLINNNLEGDLTIEDGILVDNIHTNNPLESKLKLLLESKDIYDLNFDNLDKVISLITDNIIEKYSNAVRSLYNENWST